MKSQSMTPLLTLKVPGKVRYVWDHGTIREILRCTWPRVNCKYSNYIGRQCISENEKKKRVTIVTIGTCAIHMGLLTQ